jgi:hypothetical protein
MRFMIIRMADEQSEAGAPPPLEAIERWISFTGGTPTITDGPFTEAKELISGFTIIEVFSRDEALEWVRRWPEPDVELELRQLITADEFDYLTDELKDVIDTVRLPDPQEHASQARHVGEAQRCWAG